jgi:hypothetical protein
LSRPATELFREVESDKQLKKEPPEMPKGRPRRNREVD